MAAKAGRRFQQKDWLSHYRKMNKRFIKFFLRNCSNNWPIYENDNQVRDTTSEYSAIYTDRSRDGDRVTSAAVFGQHVYSLRLLSVQKLTQYFLLFKFVVASSDKSKLMFCSDCLSCLKIVEIYKCLVGIGKHVIYTWIPSHMGIYGNTRKPRTHWITQYPIYMVY